MYVSQGGDISIDHVNDTSFKAFIKNMVLHNKDARQILIRNNVLTFPFNTEIFHYARRFKEGALFHRRLTAVNVRIISER